MKKLKFAVVVGCLLSLGAIPLVWALGNCNKDRETADDVTTHFFRFAYDEKEADKLGGISSNLHDTQPEKVSVEIAAAIKKDPGLETGEGFRAPLNFSPAGTDCRLAGFNIRLSNQPDTEQWLVAPLPPCGKYKAAQLNTPFWLVE